MNLLKYFKKRVVRVHDHTKPIVIYKTFDTIPMTAFDAIPKTGNYDLLIKGEHNHCPIDLPEVWESINNEYYEFEGLPLHMKKYISIMNKWIGLQVKILCDGRKDLQIFADNTYRRALKLIKAGESMDIYKIASLMTMRGIVTDPSVMSAKLFLSHLKTLNEHGESSKG